MPYRLLKETFLATFVLLSIVIAIGLIPFKFEFIKPIKQEFDDFDIYDLIYNTKTKEHPLTRDTNIVLIQAAYSRSAIDSQIKKIITLNPAVLGIDLSFEDSRPESDSPIVNSILKNNNIVVGYSLNTESPEQPVKEKMLSQDYFIQNGGYINFAHTDSNSVIRSFAPFFKKDENRICHLQAA